MKSLERLTLAFNLKEPDRVPVAPYFDAPASRVLGFKLSEYFTDGKKLAAAQMAAFRQYKYDWVIIATSAIATLSEAMGCKVAWPEYSYPIIKPVVKVPADINKLKVPDPHKDGRMPHILEAIRILRENLQNETLIRVSVASPFGNSARVRGPNKFLKDLYTDPELAHKLIEITLDSTLEFGKAMVEAGAQVINIGADMESPVMISPKFYEKYAQLANIRLSEELSKLGVYVIFHMCGDLIRYKLVEKILETKVDAIWPGVDVDLSHLKQMVGDKVCVLGNVDPLSVMVQGTPKEVKEESKKCIEKAARGGGFILSAGGSLSLETPPENMHAMVAAAEKYGRYPM